MITENHSDLDCIVKGSGALTPKNGSSPTRGPSSADFAKDVVFQTMLAQRLDTPLDALCALTSWSISPELGVWLLEFIRHQRPQRLIELGSGVSTLLMADALRKQGGGRLLSIEHSEKYYESTKALLTRAGLAQFVNLALCPLDTIRLKEGGEHCWYGIPDRLVSDFLAGSAVDFILVDGPPGAVQKCARYPALPVLRRFLGAHSVIVLDDAARDDEAEVAERWVAESKGQLKCEMMVHIRRSPAMFYVEESQRLLMPDNNERNMSVIDHDNIIGPMTDYVTDLVKRNLLRLEVAEGIALKHQLLLQTEECIRLQQEQGHRHEAAASSSALAEAKRANAVLEEEIAKLRMSYASSVREQEEARRRLESAEVEARQLKEERDDLHDKLAQVESEKLELRRAFDEMEHQCLVARSAANQVTDEYAVLRQQLGELQRQLTETEQQRGSIETECQILRRDLEVSKQNQLIFAKEKVALVKQSDVNETIARKKVETLTARIEELKNTVLELKERGSDSKSKLLALKASMDESASMSKEVFAWVDNLQRELLRTGHELGQTKERLLRTKHHLSYRLGGVLVNNAGSLKGILSIPGKLLQQKREFADLRKQTRQTSSDPSGPHLVIDEGINYSYARTRWRTLQLNTREQGGTLTISLLTPSAGRAVSIEISSTRGFVYLESADGRSKQPVGQEPVRLDLISDGRTRVLHVVAQAGPVVISLRRAAGVSAIVKLHMTPLDVSMADYRPKHTPALTISPARSTSKSLSHTEGREPKPMKSAIIWQAHQMMQEGRAQDAIEFAKKHARDFIRPAVELLIANSQKDHEQAWLDSVNRYLVQFRISPLAIAPEGENRFLRLFSQSREIHERGPLISVIMPAFNSARTIEHSVRSILNQTWRNLEIFVIDDASEDNTGAIVRKIAAGDSRVKIVRNARNVGPYVSKNLALQFCKGDYITGHDADDWAHPDRIAGQVRELLNSGGHLKGNMAKMIRMMSDGTFVHFAKEGKTSDDGVLRDAAISCMFEREYFRKHLGHWDCVRFGADSELISRAQKIMQERFVKIRHMTMICLDNEGSLTNDPIHGVSKVTGISPTRKFYRDQWMSWHEKMEPTEAILPFPYYQDRKFAVPEAAAVVTADILENLSSIKTSLRIA